MIIKLFVGDTCKLQNGQEGVYRLISRCLSAQNSLLKNITPQICGFQGFSPIVCCLENEKFEKRTSRPGDISRQSEIYFIL